MTAEQKGAKFGGSEALTLQEGCRLRGPPPRRKPRRSALLRTSSGGFSADGSCRRPPSAPSQPPLDPSPSPSHAHRRAICAVGACFQLFDSSPLRHRCASGRLCAQAGQEAPSEPGRAADTWRRRRHSCAAAPMWLQLNSSAPLTRTHASLLCWIKRVQCARLWKARTATDSGEDSEGSENSPEPSSNGPRFLKEEIISLFLV